MDTYKEYPIRCITCNGQLACISSSYEELIEAGNSIEDSLNLLGISSSCCRIGMMNPTIVSFDMENRDAIEGIKSVDAVDMANPVKEDRGRPIFNRCLNVSQLPTPGIFSPAVKTNIPAKTGQEINIPSPVFPPRTTPMNIPRPGGVTQQINILPGISPSVLPKTQLAVTRAPAVVTNIPGVHVITHLLPTAKRVPLVQPIAEIETKPQTSSTDYITAIAPDILGRPIEPLGEGIPVTGPVPDETHVFLEPTIAGIPVINPDPLLEEVKVYVGNESYVTVLNGRSYLAR